MAEKCNINLGEINERIETLVVTNSFMEGTTDQLIADITKELKNISEEYTLSNITEVVDTIYSTLLDQGAVDRNPTFFNITNIKNILEGNKLGVLPNTQSQARAEHASFQEAEQMQLRQNVTSEFLDNAYGMVTEAKKQAMDTANQNIFDALFINRGSIKIEGQDVGIVASNLEMNKNIRIYQQQLLNKIVEYLNSIIKPSMSISEEAKDALANPILYKDGEITQVLTHLRPLITSYLSRSRFMSSSDITGTSLDGLRSLYKRANNSSDPTYKSARLELDAYNANIILQNFDSYLDVILGDIIEIQDFGKKTGRDNKYAIGKKTAKLLTTWTTSEDRDVESEADFITKLAINTTPLYNWQGSTPISGKFLTFADYQYIIGKIKDLAWNESAINHVMIKPARYGNRLDTPIYWNSLSEKTQKIIESIARNSDGTLREVRFSSLINVIRRNPRKYLSAIFELLSNQNFINTVGFNSKIFSDGDKKVIYSLSKGVFSPLEVNSLYNLSKLDAETDYYSFITQVADTIFNVGYVQYYRDEEGVLQARTFVSQNINNLRRNIETTINTANSTRTIKDISVYENKLQLEENSKNQITFTIPNTNITATVHTSGSAVIFTDKNGQIITNFEALLQDSNVLQFLDSKLRLNINDDIDLQNALVESFEGKSKLMQDLLSFASRIVLNQHIISKYIDPIQDIIEKEVKLKELFGNNAPKYDKQLEMVNSISGADINTLRTIAIAKANTAGITTATQTKDGAGNGQSMQTQSRLLGSQWSQFELQEKQAGSATKDCLILNVPGLYEGAFTAKEYYDGMESKSFVDMCVSEFSYASFVNDYIGGLAISLTENPNSLVGDGHVMFLPSVNSDKGTIGRIKINLNKAIPTKDGTVKPIREFNHEELRWLIAKQFGTVYTRMYEAVQNDWNTLHQFATTQLTIPPFDYLSNFEAFNQWWVQNSHIEVIKGKEVRIGNTFGEKSPADFIKTLTLQYNQSHRLNPLTFIDQTHFQSKEQIINVDGESIKVKGSLASNQVLISQIARYNPTYLNNKGIDSSLYPDEQTFWKTKHKEVLKSLLKSRFEINTTGDKQKQKELEYLRKNYPTWINASGNVVLAKVNWNGRIIDITSARDLIRFRQYKDENGHIFDREVSDAILIDELPNIQLHPAIETWNYLDYLFTQEFMDCTVGSFINHPEKSKGKSREEIIREAEFKAANGFTEGINPRPALYKRVLEQEAAHFQAQHKRNVSFTASMHEFQLNLLNGIPEVYNLAVIDDIHDEQGTIMGLLNDIKPFDGATFVNPFVVLLENFALGGARAGISKKQFVHFKNERTGGGGIIKTAGFGLTNDWIRNSPFLQKMMQKMTNHVWLNEDGSPAIVNITKDYKGNQITLNNRYFEQNGRVFEIIRIESLGNNQYRRVIQEIQIDQYKRPLVNSHIGPEITESPKIINTNYLLWQFFGGDRSMSIDNSGNYLEYSNSSVENVVTIMNRCAGEDANGNIITKNNISIDEIETQDDLWQPLKQVDVHYLATAGAVKQGAANINSNSKYYDDVAYDTQRIKMYQAGIQLDKEHHADDAELSLMTQVISACAAKGYTFEAATRLYDALRKSTEIGIKEHLNAVKEFITSNDITGVQEAMYEAIIHSLGTSKTNQNNFAYLVASDLIRQAREGKKIKFSEASLPLSDKTIYSKIFSTVASYLTNAGIKQKIPGILSVLTPSHNIFKIYAGRKYESFTNPEQELEELQKEEAPIFDSAYQWTQGQGDFAGLQLVYVNPGELISQIDGQPVAMRNPHDGRVLIDLELMKAKFDQKAWRSTRNSKPLNYDFKTFDEWMRFALLHEAMHNVYLIKEGESRFDYETRVNEQALKRIQNNISNLELGREYLVTRDIMTEVEDADGNLIQVPQTQSELIRTPSEYHKLKQDILDGKVTRVIENVTVGRDLAAYNVRFNTTDGHRFQLWDLDSAQALYQINAAKELSEPDRTNTLLQIAQDIFPQHTIDINKLETLVRRMLQKDLMNLSQITPDVLLQYEELLKSQATFQPTSNQNQVSYKWAVNAPNSYEVSSAGDNRFSALFARFAQGTQFMGQDISNMTIEDVYQKVIKKSGKGLPPAQDSILYNPSLTSKTAREDFSYKTTYLPLWQLWASQNRTLIEELRQAVKGKVLTDKFAPNTTVTQARALADILTQTDSTYTSSSTKIEDRVTNPVIAENLRKLSPALQNVILSYPLGSWENISSDEQWEIFEDKITKKFQSAVNKLSKSEKQFFDRIVAGNGDRTLYIGYYLRTGRFFEEDRKQLENQQIQEYNQSVKSRFDKGELTQQEYQTALFNISENVYNQLESIANVESNEFKNIIPGIINNASIEDQSVDLQQWYNRYAQWVNIYLGTGNGSKLILPTFSGRVTADNFNTVEPLVRQAIINSTKVRIGGDLKTVDKSSINIQAYELIMPKTFATNFGLKQFDSLSEIESNPNWFVEQYRQNNEVQVESNSYSIALKTSTGNHTYLLSKAQLDTIDTQKYHKVDRSNLGLMSVDGKNVRLDSKGNIIYEVSDDFELYVDDKGNEIIVTNDLTFYINNTSFESIQISQNLLERPQVFRSILDSIKKSKNKIAKSFYNYITFGKESNLTNIFNNSVEYNRIPNENEVEYQTNLLIRALREKHTSFIKALDVVAARIPSQSMQSFMPMRVIAFDNPDINTAYVSTMQILLQGSDSSQSE